MSTTLATRPRPATASAQTRRRVGWRAGDVVVLSLAAPRRTRHVGRAAASALATIALLAAWAFGGASPALAQAGADAPQHRLVASSHDVDVQANLYAYCRSIFMPQGLSPGACSDGPPTATATRLPVHRGGTVALVTGAPVTYVVARYYDGGDVAPPSDPLKVRALDASRRRFSVELPQTAPPALLLVTISYRDLPGAGGSRESGSADFAVGLTEHRHKLMPSAVTAHPQVNCGDAAIGGDRRCRLRARGIVRRPSRTEADCRGGRVLVRVFARGRRVLRTSVATSAACRYELRDRSFALPAGAGSVLVRTRFLGSTDLAARSAATTRVRLR